MCVCIYIYLIIKCQLVLLKIQFLNYINFKELDLRGKWQCS